MIKGIRIKKVNKQLHNSFAKLRLFLGTVLKHPKYCVVPFLIPKIISRIILHGECTNVNNSFRKDCKFNRRHGNTMSSLWR